MPAILQVAPPSPRGSRHEVVPIIARDVHKRPANSFHRHLAPPPVPACPVRPSVGRREGGGKSGRGLTAVAHFKRHHAVLPTPSSPRAWHHPGGIKCLGSVEGSPQLAGWCC